MGKEVTKAAIHGCKVSSYDLLLWYVDKVGEMNPSRVITIDDEGNQFKHNFFFLFLRLFIGVQEGVQAITFY